MTAAQIEKSITDPNATIAKGYAANIMPQTFAQSIKPEDLKALVQFLYKSTHKGK